MNTARIHILLIEDNVPDADYLQEMLAEVQNPSFSVLHAARLSKGLELLISEKIDAVLLDLGLPDSQGMETLVKRQEPGAPGAAHHHDRPGR